MRRNQRYVAKSEAGKGWRIWNRKMKRWWGEWYQSYPEKLLDELNGLKRPEEITRLTQVLKTEK